MNVRRAILQENDIAESLPPQFEGDLLQLVYDSPYSYAGCAAMQALNEYYGGTYYVEAFAPRNAAINRSMRTSANSVEIQLMQLYPIPASNLINIKLTLPQKISSSNKIVLTDANGKLIEELSVQQADQIFTLDLSNWKSGMYNATLFSEGKLIQSKKFNVIE